jgi:hemoglobin/transferrin/lactoferrin receptor protein
MKRLNSLARLLAVASIIHPCATFAATSEYSPAPASAPVQVEQIVVTATRTERPINETPGTITAIDFDDFAAADFGAIVRNEPLVSAPFTASGTGVAYQRSGYNSYNIRGIEGNRVLQQVDGIRIPDEFRLGGSEPVGRDYFDPELFKRVEILHGSASALYGSDALGGVVSFATKSPEDYLAVTDRPVHGGYKGAWRSVNRSVAHTATIAAEAGAFSALAVYSRRDGHEIENNGTVAPNPEEFSSDALLTKFVWRPAPAHRVEFAAEWLARANSADVRNKEVTAGTATTADLHTDSATERVRVSATYTFRPLTNAPGLFDMLEARLYAQDAVARDHTRELISYSPPNAASGAFRDRRIITAFHNDTTGLSIAAVKSVGAAHRLAFGLEGSRTDTSKPWSSTNITERTGTTFPIEPRMADTRTDRLGAYLQDEFTFTLGDRRATLIPGVRVDHFKLNPDNSPAYLAVNAGQPAPGFEATAVSPKLGFVVSLVPRLNIFAQYNRGFRYPTAEDLTATFTNPTARYKTIPNPNLKEETSDAWEVGVKGHVAPGVTVRAAAFYTTYANFIEQIVATGVFDPAWPSGIFQTQNRADARIYGGEISARFALGGGLSASAAVGYSKGSYTTLDGERTVLTTIEPLRGNATFAYDNAKHRFGAALTLDGADGKRPGTGAVFRAPGYALLDLTGYWRLHERATLHLALHNLTDRRYWRYANIRGLTVMNLSEQQRRTEPGLHASASIALRF